MKTNVLELDEQTDKEEAARLFTKLVLLVTKRNNPSSRARRDLIFFAAEQLVGKDFSCEEYT